MSSLDKLRALMRDMEGSLGIIGDIIGALTATEKPPEWGFSFFIDLPSLIILSWPRW